MTAPGEFRVVLQDAKRGAATLLGMMGFLCALCTWGTVAVDNAWRFLLAVLAILFGSVIVLVVVQLLRGFENLTYIDARGLVAVSGKRPEQILPAERFGRFEVIDPGNGAAVTLKLRYSKEGGYEPPKMIRRMEEIPGRIMLAVIKTEDGDGSLSLEDLWRLRRFVEETGMGTWEAEPRHY
jgi:hypothetical protein